ncbi:Ser-Thr-rich glycosyl-phosphatidyl-inositol-anchored membrane family-domain-containing protein [Aspergillus pseudoustus]|uniref:Ser-Thr-rich glycosyl-phosphatidyl-inositol-anchored membrane family-domain-containing protein n=1 Tax=Aspergillus pseudoustus TaxID=1810923 RepID=A0ABR4K9U2_9EURO
MRFSTAGVLSAIVAVAAAWTTPDYSQAPTGNAIIKPGLNELVTAGEAYTVTWDPTTEGLISLVLLRGPSTNVVPLYAIAENIPNNGQYVWTPSTDLEDDVTHYGILLVVETGANKGSYQYSTQFGVSNPHQGESSSTSTSTTATEPTQSGVIPTGTPTTPPSNTVTKTTTITTTTCPEGAPTATNPTIPTLVPSSSVPAWTPTFTPAPPQFTGAAGRNAISLGAVAAGVAAVLAF